MKRIIFFILIPFLGIAQKYELGKVTIEELQEKRHPYDTTAVAAKIFEIGRTYFNYSPNSGFELVTEVEVKIKIYKKEGLDWANKTIGYSIGSVTESVVFSKAATYNLVNGKVVKTKLNSDGEFKEKVNDNWATKKISMPNVKEGSIIEYRYEFKSSYLSRIDSWHFQDLIPVNYSQYTTEVPQYLMYNVYIRGFHNINNVSEFKTRNVSYANQGINSFSFNETKTIYSTFMVPALNQEAYSNNIRNYITSIEFELASTNFPGSGLKKISESWEDITKNFNESDYFGKELKKKNYFEEDLAKIVPEANKPVKEKVRLIFDFVKNRMQWNEKYGAYTDKGLKKAYQDKTGNVSEINLILVSMLKNSGVDASPVLLASRNRPLVLFPTRTAYDYVVCAVELNNELILLDASNKNSDLNILPTRALNYYGRIIRENGSNSDIDLSPKNKSEHRVLINAKIDPSFNVNGNVMERVTNHYAFDYREQFLNTSNESILETYEKNNPGFEFENYEVTNKKESHLPVVEKYNFSSSNVCELIGGKIFFKPMLFFTMDENPFKLKAREYPIDFIYSRSNSYDLVFEIPENYSVDFIPASTKFATEDRALEFTYMIEEKGNKIHSKIIFNINSSFVEAKAYDILKSFFNDVYLKMNEKVVLKKN